MLIFRDISWRQEGSEGARAEIRARAGFPHMAAD